MPVPSILRSRSRLLGRPDFTVRTFRVVNGYPSAQQRQPQPVWIWSTVSSLGIAIPYFAISFFVGRGLIKSNQLTSNPLGLGTMLIFFSCGAGHLLHAEHALLGDAAQRAAADLHITLWDLSTAAIAIWYLSMRARFGQLLTSPAMFEDHTRLAAETQSRHDATHDHLTALPNRQALFDALDQALDPTTSDETCALLFVDLDGFKDVNDRFGHIAGDDLLIAAGERLRSAIRPHDMLARIGGDEFVILLAGATTEAQATAVANRQTAALVAPFSIAQDSVSLTVSTGIALGEPGQLNAAELLHRADCAMYQAKQAGPGRYRVHGADSPLATAGV